MADEGKVQPPATAYLGVITAGRREHLTQTQMYQRINAYATERGWTLPPGGAVAFNRIMASEHAYTTSVERFSKARSSDAIIGRYIGPLTYGQGAATPASVRRFDVRVPYTYQGPAGLTEDYVTLRYTGGLPATVGDLIAEAQDVTQSLVEGYSRAIVEWGTLEIGEL